jgi:hypothetical protein
VFQVDTECWESVTQGGEQMTKREPNSLTNEEIQEFAIELLQGGNTHIYELALSLYSVDVDDDLLPKLKEIGGILYKNVRHVQQVERRAERERQPQQR